MEINQARSPFRLSSPHSPVKLDGNLANLRNNPQQSKFRHGPLFRCFEQYVKVPIDPTSAKNFTGVEGKKAVFREYLVS